MNKFRIFILFVLVVALGWAFPAHGTVHAAPLLDGTTHSGVLATDETWYASGNPHTIDGSLTVPAGITLTLQPGVVVHLVNNGGYGQVGLLTINGTLTAVGSSADHILFTSGADSAPGEWGGLIVSGGSAQLAYAEVRYAGYGWTCTNISYSAVCVQNAGTLSIDYTDFHDNSGPAGTGSLDGAVAAYSASDADLINLSITHSTFQNNGLLASGSFYPVLLNGPGIRLVMAGNTFTANQVNRVLLQNNPLKTQTSAILTDQVGLEAYELYPAYLSNHIVPVGSTLTVEPGVKLLTHPGAWSTGYAIIVEGTLIVQGTEADPIVMDGTDPAWGWGGLIVQGAGSAATLEHTEVLHGGHPNGSNPYSNVAALSGGRVSISHSRIADNVLGSSNYASGVIHLADGSLSLTDSTISNTMTSGVQFYAVYAAGANSALEMTGNTFSGNSINAVLLGVDGLAGTRNTLRPQTGLLGYDFGVPYSSDTYTLLPAGNLTLEPGTTVRGVVGPWNKGAIFKVQGQLNASGTADEPVIFQAVDDALPAAWGGIYVNGGTANLVYVTVRNAGRGQGYPYLGTSPSLSVDADGHLSVYGALISNNQNFGWDDTTVTVDNATASIRNSTFSNNGNPNEKDYPVSVSGAASKLTLSGNQFDIAGYKRVLLKNNAMTGADFSLPRLDGLEGYELSGKITVPAGVTLTVQPGAKIMGGWGSGLMINGGLVARSKPGQEIVFTSSTDDGTPGQWAGVIFSGTGAHGVLDGVSLRCGGAAMSGYYEPLGTLIMKDLAPNAVQVLRSQISNSETAAWQIVNSNVTQNTILDGNRVLSNPGDGLRISGTSQVILANTVALDTVGSGIITQSGAQAALLHTTLAGNTYGLSAKGSSSLTLTNTILSQNTVGASVDAGSTINLSSTLWDANTTPTLGSGTLVNTTPYSGPAALAPSDGYHLTLYSQALAKGQSTGISTDVDGRSRPQPAGSSPDLGADEFNQSAVTEMTAEKVALPPVWINLPDAGGNPSGELVQQYWIRYLYGSDDPSDTPVNVTVVDTLPAGLNFESEVHTPAMRFLKTGQVLQWETDQPVSPGQGLFIRIDTRDTAPVAGSTYTNTAALTAGSQNFNLSAETEVPIFAPLITWPVNGELCAQEDSSLEVKGSAQPGTTVKIYEYGTLKGQAVTDAQGLFTVAYSGSLAGTDVILNARACNGANCSEPTSVTLTPAQSFWCPQRSSWSGTPSGGPLAGRHLEFGFLDQNGYASSSEWWIEGVLGFSNTQLHLHSCGCPPSSGTTSHPTQMWVEADGVTYAAAVGSSFPDYHFDITGSAHNVTFWAQCEYDEDDEHIIKKIDDHGHIVIDPDGYVFDSTLGFDAADPTANVLPGSTVTCMANIPEWGGWVPWPAHLYLNQVNPQVVGANGYFSFFTPPGEYYLQVDPPAGYQPWRSPVVTVVNKIVHVNVPITPTSAAETFTLTSSTAGISQPNFTVPVGAQVRWVAALSPLEDASDLIGTSTDPVLHLLSDPDPFASIDGWDSGRMIPGESYTRQFNTQGTYTYTDGAGHTASVHVVPAGTQKIFLPILRK